MYEITCSLGSALKIPRKLKKKMGQEELNRGNRSVKKLIIIQVVLDT